MDLTSGEEARVLVRFDGYRGRYVFHCHNLEHEDMVMANFEVVRAFCRPHRMQAVESFAKKDQPVC